MITKRVLFTIQSEKELLKLPKDAYDKFDNIFRLYTFGDDLSKKLLKKLSGIEIYEFRVKVKSGIYRGLGFMKGLNFIMVKFFKKKTQKTPKQEIQTAIKRINNLDYK